MSVTGLIDYMEYSSDALAQAAYVSSDVEGYGSDTIPDMSSNTAPSGVASASSTYVGGAWAAYRAMDNASSSRWCAKVVVPAWLKYAFDSGVTKTARKYTIRGNPSGQEGKNPKSWTFQGSNNGSSWTTLDTQSNIAFSAGQLRSFAFSNSTAYRYYRLYITAIPAVDIPSVSELEIMEMETHTQCYSEDTIKEQGSYSLKGYAQMTNSLNDTLTRTVSPVIDLSGQTSIKLDIRASRTGSNIKVGIHDSGGTTTEHTINVASADTWQTETWDISGVSDVNKDAIDSIIVTILNADVENTFYIDNMHSLPYRATLENTLSLASIQVKKAIKDISNSLAIAAVITKNIRKTIDNTLSLTSIACKNISVTIANALALVSVIWKTPGRTITNTLGLASSVIKKPTKAISNALDLTQALVKNATKVIFNTLTLVADVIQGWLKKGIATFSWTKKDSAAGGTWTKKETGTGGWVKKDPPRSIGEEE